jgi:DnaJ-class molecular chaperone
MAWKKCETCKGLGVKPGTKKACTACKGEGGADTLSTP